jgi:hypothetical protein
MRGARGNTGCGPIRGAKRGGQQLTTAFASFRAERGKRLFISHFVPPISLSPCEPCNRMYSSPAHEMACKTNFAHQVTSIANSSSEYVLAGLKAKLLHGGKK